MNNIQRVKPHCAGTEFFIIALIYEKKSHPSNSNPEVTSVEVRDPLRVRSCQNPYISYWSSCINYNAVR